jgi:hypothetical protein
MELSILLIWNLMEDLANIHKTRLAQLMVLDTVMHNVLKMSSSSMVKRMFSIGTLAKQKESGEPAALKWIFGKQTPFHHPIQPTLAALMELLDAIMILTVERALTDTKDSVIRMVAISTLTDTELKTSLDQAPISRLILQRNLLL